MSLTLSAGSLSISLGSGGLSGLGSWADALTPASWRGIPFFVVEEEVGHGRRTAVHEYPFRDKPYVEDLGLGPRRFTFHAFLVGDDVFDQADALDDAVDTPNAGTLVHPSLGSITASLISFTRRTRADAGRVVECELGFVEQGTQQFPSAEDNTGDAIEGGADAATGAAADDFGADVAGPIGQSAQQVNSFALATLGPVSGAVDTISDAVGEFAGLATPFVADAAMIAGAVRGLVPASGAWFGRYSAGSLALSLPATATVGSVLAAGVTAASAVIDAAANAVALARAL